MTAITFIGFGEAGGILAGDLARENDVTIWDHKLQGAERAAMREKAHLAGVRVADSLARRWRAALIFSTVTAGSALEVALAAAEYVREGQFFLDLNSVAPETKRIAANRFCPGPISMWRSWRRYRQRG